MKLKEHIEKFDESMEESLGESPKPFAVDDVVSEVPDLFASVEKLEGVIQDKDKIIESLNNELTKLTNQVYKVEEEKSTILEELEQSWWLKSKVSVATKRVYEDKVKSIISENRDSKIIPLLTAVARKKQGNQQLTFGNWLKIPENRYLFQINEDIAKGMFGETNNLIERRFENESVRGGGMVETPTELVNSYSLTFDDRIDNNTGEYVTTGFNPDDYNLNLGFTVSYWVRPDEVGTNRFAFGRKDTSQGNNQRFVFGISQPNKIHIGVGGNKMTGTWGGNLTGNPSGLTPAELFPDLFTHPENPVNSELIPGTWLHFAVTYEDREVATGKVLRKVYLNGELISYSSYNWNNIGGTTGGMYFGARNLNGVYQFGWDCGLDEVAIFDTEKDADWVTAAYNSGKPTDLTSESGLVGYWRFEEGLGTGVNDLSGKGNHGTLTTNSAEVANIPIWSSDAP